MSELTIKTNLADLPFVGDFLDGATLTTGYAEHDQSTVANADDAFDLTAALNVNVGQFKLGYRKNFTTKVKLELLQQLMQYGTKMKLLV